MRFPKLLSFFLLFALVINISASQPESRKHLEDAWTSWVKNDKKTAEQKFKDAIEEDKNNIRAYIGLSYLYQSQYKDKEAWQAYREVINRESNFYPYFYAAQYSNKVINCLEDTSSGIIDLLKRLSLQANSDGVLQAMAAEKLGEYYMTHNDPDRAASYYTNVNALKEWTLAGPFDNISASGMVKDFPVENEYDAGKTYRGKNNVPVNWFPLLKPRSDNWVDFTRYFAYTDAVYYANTFIYSPEKMTVQIRTGTSGAVKLFLNDETVLFVEDENNNDLDTYIIETELQKGWNRLLIKCGYSEISRCNFLARITDKSGKAVDGLQISIKNEKYISRPGAQVKLIKNFAESYFEEKIKENPEHLENYLLLADCYLRNDKAIEAELILNRAAKKYPNCAFIYNQLLEAYLRGEKQDELETTFEKIYNLDPENPAALEHKYTQHIENQDFDKVGEIIERLEKIIPGSLKLYLLKSGYYAQKKDFEKLFANSKEAHEKYPEDWTFTYFEAIIDYNRTKSYDRAIEIVKAYSEKLSNEAILTTLADLYLNASRIDKCHETFERLLKTEPSGTGYYYKLAEIYFALQNYAMAEKYLEKTIELCPNSSVFFARMGEVKQILKQEDKAREYYSKALEFDPANYAAREKLRELLNRKSIFTRFEQADINSLIKNSPSKEEYPGDNAVILLEDFKRVVYEEGTSETSDELLVKVFNADGIDAFKEYYISYNPNIENLIIEKAVVIKKDGSEIKADIDDNQLVFKSLGENEFIYIKWKLRNMYSGKLSRHFWDEFYFNQGYPVKKISYSLLVPEKLKFNYYPQNMAIEPRIEKKGEDGLLYSWEMKDLPSVVYEPFMPPLVDVGKILFVSSIDSWEYFVDWYLDIALPKARSSYEIKETVHELIPADSRMSEMEKVKTIYEFITENIQYSSVSFRQSGLIPQKARDVLVNRIGDCKDVATLCIAMLSEAGIRAHHVLVNTKDQGLYKNTLPQISFNHCIVGAELSNGRMVYMDLTARNYPVGTVPENDLDAYALLIKKGVKAPFYLNKNNFMSRNVIRNTVIKASEDNSVFITRESYRTGAAASEIRQIYRFKSETDALKEMTEILSKEFGNIKDLKMSMDLQNPYAGDIKFDYKFTVPGFITEAGGFKLMMLPLTDRLQTAEVLSFETREYDLMHYTGSDTLRENMEIILPQGLRPVEPDAEMKYSCPAADYSLSIKAEGNSIKVTRTLIFRKEVIKPEEYAEFKTFFNNMLKSDSRQILLKSL